MTPQLDKLEARLEELIADCVRAQKRFNMLSEAINKLEGKV
jgi:hypothetical protein